MKKKRFNSKSRTISNVEIDNSTTNEIVVDIEHCVDKYDNCNALVLPSNKRKTKNIDKKEPTPKLLSKKRRKQLEKVVERKEKKLKSANLLKELAKVQVSSAELQQYVSFTSLQNKGLKRYFRELETSEPKLEHKTNENEGVIKKRRINSIKGSNKKKVLERRLASGSNLKQDEVKHNPNVIGFEKHNYYFDSSESSDENNTDNENKDETHVSDSAATSGIVLSQRNDENNFTKDEDKKIQELKKNYEEENDEEKNDKEENDENDSTESKENKTIPNKSQECKEPKPNKSQEDKKSTKEVQQQNIILKDRTLAVFVPVDRKPEIQAARLQLPIAGEEYDLMDMINENPIIIITGETGTGKTTQLPQFLYERGYAQDKMIGITEPRRVAAMSMSKRVAEEMNFSRDKVSYQIRYEGNVTENTKIKFMTDGVLLKEIQTDFLLSKYSVIILDEAHERSVFTDVLIGLMSKIVLRRNKHNDPLKLIIMSATLRVEEFVENTKLFKVKPPVFQIHTRQHEVTIHFNKRTSYDYVNDALSKVIKIHTRLPEGGILVFLTGQKEVEELVHKLRKAFPSQKHKSPRKRAVNKTIPKEASDQEDNKNDSDSDEDAKEALRRYKSGRKKQFKLAEINLDDYSVIPTDNTEEDSNDVSNSDEDDEDDIIDFKILKDAQPMWVLPLYSLLPIYEQTKVFKPPPKGCRLCVVSTDIAETSLTISNIKYVVDSGRHKDKVYDKATGVSMYRICYVSKASATQRAGRAGRTGPGHCYRLYSSAVYNEFQEFNEPDILKQPIDNLLLQMKAMNIIKVVNFPFPTPPDAEHLKYAERRLTILELLQKCTNKQKATYCTKVTLLGRKVALYPVAPRYGKMLQLALQCNSLMYTICMVAALSVQQVLMDTLDTNDLANSKFLQIRHSWAGTGNSLLLGDVMILLKAIINAEYAVSQRKSLMTYCEENGLRHKALVEVRKLRQQLAKIVKLPIDPMMPLPSESTTKELRITMLTGLADQVARKVSPDEIEQWGRGMMWRDAYKTSEMKDPVYMHPTCVLQKITPEWVVYQEIYETKKMYMRGVTAIEPEWLPIFAPTLCRLSEPLADPRPRYHKGVGKVLCHVTGTFGKAAWPLPCSEIEYPLNEDCIKWFLYFFLNGEVCPKLEKFVPSLLSTPSSVNQTWAKLVPRIHEITLLMVTYKIMTKNKLLETWTSNKQFLLSAYQKWLPQSLHAEVALLWPPL